MRRIRRVKTKYEISKETLNFQKEIEMKGHGWCMDDPTDRKKMARFAAHYFLSRKNKSRE